MRVVRKDPGTAPVAVDIVTGPRNTGVLQALQTAIGGNPGSCITHDGVRVWCDDDALVKKPRPPLNLVRPTDSAPIHGTVVVTGEDEHGGSIGLTDRQVALWMATLTLIGFYNNDSGRHATLAHLSQRIHPDDKQDFTELQRRIL